MTGQAGLQRPEVLLGEGEGELADVVTAVEVDAQHQREPIALTDDPRHPRLTLDGMHHAHGSACSFSQVRMPSGSRASEASSAATARCRSSSNR